jgi:hypothetical protein
MLIEISKIQSELIAKNDLDWFDGMCEILKKENRPTVALLTNIIGTENKDIARHQRGSRFLIPFDKRFKTSCINPDIDIPEEDVKLEYLSFGGEKFGLKITDIRARFNNYLIRPNLYDGGTQIFFYPVSELYEFSAISLWVAEEQENIRNIDSLIVHSVSFDFGKHLIELRDGYSMVN